MVSKRIRIASTYMLNSKKFSGEIPQPPYERGFNPLSCSPPLEPSALAERLRRSIAVPLFKYRRRPWETRVPILPGPKPNAINPHPNAASDKIWLRLAHWLRRYSSLKMFTDARTDGRTHGRRIDRYTISSPLSLRLR